ncbi:MAG: proton-conducting membrane transporter [Lachnospiraceae bacterium]|nr:proton-conducting membrane transporter [Lachnospiraceae bacterium]
MCGVVLLSRNEKAGEWGSAFYIAAILITDALALLAIFFGEPVELLHLSPKVRLALYVDAIGKWFLITAIFLYTCVLFYSLVYMKVKERKPVFYGFYFISLGALIAVCFAENMVTIYLAFELTTLSTVPLVLHEQTKEAVAAAMKFLFYSIGGALLGLVGIFFLYTYAGDSLTFDPAGVLDPVRTAGHEQLLYLTSFIAVLGFGAKAGMFPLHGWLPTAHPIAPAPASALLSGIITKSGVLVIIRFVYYSIGSAFLAGSWMDHVWTCLTLLTIFMGSMMAFRENNLKRRLAYSTISQVSYALLGLSLCSGYGLRGCLLQVMQHGPSKACLFLCAGAFIYEYGIHDVRDLKAIGRKMPIVLWTLTFAAMSLVGIPPMGGFASKWKLVDASLMADMGFLSILAPIVLLISALLTAGYLFPIMIDGFFPGKDISQRQADRIGLSEKGPFEAAPRMMWIPLICLCGLSLFIGLFGNWLLTLL